MSLWTLLAVLFICRNSMAESASTVQHHTLAVNMNEVMVNLLQRIDTLEKRDMENREEIISLKDSLARQNDRIVELVEENRLQKSMLHELKTIIKGLESQENRNNYHGAEDIPEKYETYTEDMIYETETRQREKPRIRTELSPRSLHGLGQDKNQRQVPNTLNAVQAKVAFYATLSKDTSHLGMDQNVPFDNLVTNYGSAYNHHDGTFTAPFEGVYVFSVSIITLFRSVSTFGLALNGNTVSRMWVNGIDNDGDSCSQTIALHLNGGDIVEVKHFGVDKAVCGDQYSVLTGFLIFN